MKKLVLTVAITLFGLVPFQVLAQSGFYSYALRAEAPVDGSQTIGVRKVMNTATAVDIDFAFDFQSDDVAGGASEGMSLGLDGALVNYLNKNRVAPYFKAGAGFVLYSGDRADVFDNSFDVFGALGAEFFVTPEFSLYIEAGVRVPLTPDFAIQSGTTTAGLAFYF